MCGFPVFPAPLIEEDIFSPLYIFASFVKDYVTIGVRVWKQPKYSMADEWIKKMWYIYAMKYYSAIK